MTCGTASYTDDLSPSGSLWVKVLRSPHAHALIRSIDSTAAFAVPGVVCVLTHADLPKIRCTYAGQCAPESSPYDRYILEDRVRYVGDPVAIVAAETEQATEAALRRIRVQYKVLPAVLDFEQALDAPVVVHPEADYHNNVPIGGDVKRNLLCSHSAEYGDVDRAFEDCDLILEDTFYTQAAAHAMMETFRTCCYFDYQGRLTIVSSTQVPFHIRRIAAAALGLPQSRVRVIKPRVGGGFGAKQSIVSELLAAAVTVATGRPAKLVFTRRECFTASNSRHQMRLQVKMGATRDGVVRAIELYALGNGGAYGEQSFPTSLLVGHKTIPLYAHAAFRHRADFVYTNTMPAGACRGFGATQGCFAVESMANRVAHALGLDPAELRLKNIPHAGEVMPAYFGDVLQSSGLDRCIETGKRLFRWDERRHARSVGGGKVRAAGMAVTMQGSGVPMKDVCCATVHLNDNGYYTLHIGATDIGTGCDTILAQMAAEVLNCSVDQVVTEGVDTDHSPYDKGSYASSTTYVTGQAVVKAASALKEQLLEEGSRRLNLLPERCDLDEGGVFERSDPSRRLSLQQLGAQLVLRPDCRFLTATAQHCCTYSAPPLMAGFAEVEVDTATGKVSVTDFLGVVDCGTVINPALATVQAQGGILQGIGMALYEAVSCSPEGKLRTNSFLQYKIPVRPDAPPIRIAFEPDWEPTGPFGAKSIGEVVINTPCPAIADAVFQAVGVSCASLPITPETVWRGIREGSQ
nr:molybdopterin cofactor-binding domain-containing protein [Dysosmobacter acutus]